MISARNNNSIKLFILALLFMIVFTGLVSAAETPTVVTNITLINPVNNTIVSNNINQNFTFSWQYSVGKQTNCYLLVDNNPILSKKGYSSSSITFENVSLSTGINTWNVMCENQTNSTHFQNVTFADDRTIISDGTAPVITIPYPANNSNIEDPSDIYFNISVTDNYDSGDMNCTLSIAKEVLGNLQTEKVSINNSLISNGTFKELTVDLVDDGVYFWNVECSDNYGNSRQTEFYKLIKGIIPPKPTVWQVPTTIQDTTINVIGYSGYNNTNVSAYATMKSITNTNWTSTMEFSTILGNATIKSIVNATTILVNKSDENNVLFIVGNFISFENNPGEFFENYEIMHKEDADAVSYRIILNKALPEGLLDGNMITVQDNQWPNGWFNISLNIENGLNEIDVVSSRFDIRGEITEFTVSRDSLGPVFNISEIGNYTTLTPIIKFNVTDDAGINASTLYVNITQAGESVVGVTADTIINTSFWDRVYEIDCNGNEMDAYCFFTPTLSEGLFDIALYVNDTFGNSATASKNNLLIKTVVETVSQINDSGATFEGGNITVSWAASTDPMLDHYMVSVGTLPGQQNVVPWVNVTKSTLSIVIEADYTPGNIYYVNVVVVDTMGNVGNITSTDGIIYIDTSYPICENPQIIPTVGSFTNLLDELSASWSCSDNESGISEYEYAFGTARYPQAGWDNILQATSSTNTSVIQSGLTLDDDATIYVSMRAKSNYPYSTLWSVWKSSVTSVTTDASLPFGGNIWYDVGGFTAPSIQIEYGTGYDSISGVRNAQLIEYKSLMIPELGGSCSPFIQDGIVLVNLSETPNASYNRLGLENGYCYKYKLKVFDNAGNYQIYTTGNLVQNLSIDMTAPSGVDIVDEGILTNARSLTFSWTGAQDEQSGISHYEYALGTEIGKNDVINWTNNGMVTSIVLTNLPLEHEKTYYLSVRAVNNHPSPQASISHSNGILYLDNLVPSPLNIINIANDNSTPWIDNTTSNYSLITLQGERALACIWSFYDVGYAASTNDFANACVNMPSSDIYTCNITGLSEGIYNTHIACKDEAGNSQSENNNLDIQFTKEMYAPQISIINPTNDSIQSGELDVEMDIFDASSFGAYYELVQSLSGKVIATENITQRIFSVDISDTSGVNTFTVYANDSTGKISNQSISFIVNNDMPNVIFDLGNGHKNSNFTLPIIGTLYNNVSYNITDDMGNLMTSGLLDNNLTRQNKTSFNLDVDVDVLIEGNYSITGFASGLFNGIVKNYTYSSNFIVDKSAPTFVIGSQEISNNDIIFENSSVKAYIEFRENEKIRKVYFNYTTINSTTKNITADITLPGELINEGAIRYTVEVPVDAMRTNRTLYYNWIAQDFAGNTLVTAKNNFVITNRPANITTMNISSGLQGIVGSDFIFFNDEDLSQNNASYFNCSLDIDPFTNHINATVQDNTRCLLEWDSSIAPGNYTVNLTVTDLIEDNIIGSVLKSFNFTIQASHKHNFSIESSHPITISYRVDNSTVRTAMSYGSEDTSILIPNASKYDVQLSSDTLTVELEQYNANDTPSLYLQELNKDFISYSEDNLGSGQQFVPEKAYGISVLTQNNNQSYRVSFNYDDLGIDPRALDIFKYEYNKTLGKINYTSNVSMHKLPTSIDWANKEVFVTVKNFSAFILAHNTKYTEPVVIYPNAGGSSSGGSSRRSSGSSGFTSVRRETCSDGILNQDEIGIDCGGLCEACIVDKCFDGILNQGETGIDCGGPCKISCPQDRCFDGILNHGETGIDCGGPCKKQCILETCFDGILNHGETGIDCGGPCQKQCVRASCFDGIHNQGEEKIDCGGPCTPCVETPGTVTVFVNSIPSYIWFIMIGIVIAGITATSLIYKKETNLLHKESLRLQRVKNERNMLGQEVSSLVTEDLSLIGDYVKKAWEKGFSNDIIRAHLIKYGYKEENINAVFNALDKEDHVDAVMSYFERYTSDGYSVEELCDWLSDSGVDVEVLSMASSRYKKGHTAM